jgi:hypothetical protein
MHPVGSRNGVQVYVNLTRSPAAIRISQQPHILTLAKELLDSLKLKGPKVVIEHDFGRIIGNTDVVETGVKDTVVYAKKLRQATYCRFVRRRQMAPSQFLSMILVKDDTGNYELRDIWVGRQVPAFPGDEDATPESKLYWENHALVIDGQTLQLSTLTKTAPY